MWNLNSAAASRSNTASPTSIYSRRSSARAVSSGFSIKARQRRRIERMIRALAMLLFWALIIPVGALILFPWAFITGDVESIYRFGMWGARSGIRVAGVRVRLVGRDHLDPQRAYVYMANHVSNLDPPALIPYLPQRASVMVKNELFRVPLLGRAMRMVSLVPIDRRNKEAAIASVRAAAEVLRSGISVVVFPEGTRSPDGRLLPFKKAPFHMALETGAP